MKIFEALLPVCFALFGLCCALGATEPAFSLQKDYLGVSGYPRVVGLLLAAFCLWGLRRGLLPRQTARQAAAGETSARQLLHAAAAVALATAYVAGVSWLGFIISTFVYLCAMPCFLGGGAGRSALLRNVLYACCVTAVMAAFFKGFKIYLPAAVLF